MNRFALCLSLWLAPMSAWAQFGAVPVMEVGPMTVAHTTTALQQTLNTIESIWQSSQWVLEMTPYGGLGTSWDMHRLDPMIDEVQQLLFNLEALQRQAALFGLDGAPSNYTDLNERLRRIRAVRAEQQAAARRLQTLPQLVGKIIANVERLRDRILDILGNKQGHQQAAALLVEQNKLQAYTQTLIGGYNQAMLTDAQEQTLIEESVALISADAYASWPRAR